MIQEAIQKLIDRQDLTAIEAETVMDEIMSGKATDAQIAGFLVALRIKGETIDEITACAKVMRKKASRIRPSNQDMLVDVVGTGGDRSGTFNISTAAAFVVAGAGVPVAKHGNKGVSSKSGSADVLSALGVKIDLSPAQVEKCISTIGIGYMFAPGFHGAMKYAIGPRKELGIRTIFNILGPLTNPAEAPYELMGVFAPSLVEPLATVLGNLGCKHAVVVHGSGLDEISISGSTTMAEFKSGKVAVSSFKPSDVGMKTYPLTEIKGGSPEDNKEILLNILGGKEKGAKRQVVVLNEEEALYAAGKTDSIQKGIPLAEKSIDSGKALAKLEALREFTCSQK